MGEAVWLYLWLLDKMTSVNENGVGKVLGNQPVTNELIAADLGIHRNTYGKYVKRLREAGYIQTIRSPYGLIITVNKAEKIFTKRSTRTSASKKLSSDAHDDVQLKRDAHERVPKMHTIRASDAHDDVHVIKTIQDNTIDNTSITNVIDEKVSSEKKRYGKPEINELFDFWESTVGYKIEGKVTANRRAASTLLKKHGKSDLERLIQGVALSHEDRYGPRISDFSQLQQKVNELIAWGRRQTTPKKEERKGPKGVKL